MKKKRKLERKLLSFLLTLAMVVGLVPGMNITVHAEQYSGNVYDSELKEGDILAAGTAIELDDEKTFKLQANGWCSENGTAGQSDFEISSAPISVSSEGTITIGDEKFYPYANGTKVDKWEVISVESDVITLVGYDGITKYPIWVGGIRVTSANADNIDGQSKASYDVTTNTLTLDNYIYEGAGYKFNNSYAGIYYRPNDSEQNLTINLKGTNSVTCRPPHEEEVSLTSINGIYFDNYSNLTIKGDGSLTTKIDGKDVYDTNEIYSISVKGNLVIEKGANVVASGCEESASKNVGVYSLGGKITVNGTLEIKGEQAIGICMDAGNGQMTVTGTLIASGADKAFSTHFSESFQYTVPEGYTVTESGNIDGTDATPVSVGNKTSASAKYVKIMPTPKDPVSYMAWDETEKKLVEKTGDDACKEYEVVTADTTTFEDGKWYVVSNSVTVSNRITAAGTTNLILCDGATLTASKGITVNSGNTINIYAQIGGTGELNAGSDTSVASIGGGARGASSGTVNIHGGKITATGGSNASGIGGALEGGNGEVNIYSGEVTARGKNYAAGIGGYTGKSGGTVNIYGGTVNASGSQYGTTGIGIGGKNPGNCVVHIYGGEVTATSEKAAAGIQGTVTIDGGTVTANGGVSDAIDCSSGETYSSNGINGTVTVNGGTVTAFGGNVTGDYVGAIESYGGTIYACSGINGTVTISGGTVTATGGNVTGDINIYGGTIYAGNGVNGTVTISGGTVTATGGSHTGEFNSYSSGTTVKEKGFGGSLTIGDSMKVFGGDNADPTTEIEKSNDDYARFKYMLVKLGHVHSFTYEANDATIKATCSQNDCTLNDGQGNHTAILTIGAPTLNTYGQTGAGISAEATITDADNIKGTATVVYKKGDETLASAPTDAGTYTASITLGTVTASVEYTIAQKEVTVSGITASDKIYAGNTDATLVTTAAAFTGKLDGDTLTVSATGTFDNANVGENKTVTISNLTLDGTSKDNYVLAATGQQTTTTAKITAREIDLIWSNTELAYTGEAQKPTATATGVVEGDTCTVTVSGEQTNIGDNYTATAESLSNSNYKLPENKTTAFKITKADAVAATVTANNRTYDGTDKPLVNVDNSTLVGGEMRYALGENATTAPAENLYNTSIPKATNAGTYYVWYKVVGDENHNDVEPKSLAVTINEKQQTSNGTITTDGIYCASNYPTIQAGMVIEKSNEEDTVEYRWVACDTREPLNWFEVSPWTKNNNCIDWTPEKSGSYVFVCYARVVGNEEESLIQYAFGTEYHSGIKGICQIPYSGEGGGYLIGIESYNNPNNSYQYEMLILDCSLLAQGKDAWIYTTGRCGAKGNSLWTVWQPQYGYYWTLFRIYDADGNMIDEQCYGFANVN